MRRQQLQKRLEEYGLCLSGEKSWNPGCDFRGWRVDGGHSVKWFVTLNEAAEWLELHIEEINHLEDISSKEHRKGLLEAAYNETMKKIYHNSLAGEDVEMLRYEAEMIKSDLAGLNS